MPLGAGGLAPYLPPVADAIWWAGAALSSAFQVWGLCRVGGRHRAGARQCRLDDLFIGGISSPARASRSATSRPRASCGGSPPPSRGPLVMGLGVLSRGDRPAAARGAAPELVHPARAPSLIYATGWRCFPSSFLEICILGAGPRRRAAVYARNFLRGPSLLRGGRLPSRSTLWLTLPRLRAEPPSMLWQTVAAAAVAVADAVCGGRSLETARSAASRAA